jgi:hypothetical protein
VGVWWRVGNTKLLKHKTTILFHMQEKRILFVWPINERTFYGQAICIMQKMKLNKQQISTAYRKVERSINTALFAAQAVHRMLTLLLAQQTGCLTQTFLSATMGIGGQIY